MTPAQREYKKAKAKYDEVDAAHTLEMNALTTLREAYHQAHIEHRLPNLRRRV